LLSDKSGDFLHEFAYSMGIGKQYRIMALAHPFHIVKIWLEPRVWHGTVVIAHATVWAAGTGSAQAKI